MNGYYFYLALNTHTLHQKLSKSNKLYYTTNKGIKSLQAFNNIDENEQILIIHSVLQKEWLKLDINRQLVYCNSYF